MGCPLLTPSPPDHLSHCDAFFFSVCITPLCRPSINAELFELNILTVRPYRCIQVGLAKAQFFQVALASPPSSCYTVSSGLCFTDGLGNHANSESCSITVLFSTTLRVIEFQTEA